MMRYQKLYILLLMIVEPADGQLFANLLNPLTSPLGAGGGQQQGPTTTPSYQSYPQYGTGLPSYGGNVEPGTGLSMFPGFSDAGLAPLTGPVLPQNLASPGLTPFPSQAWPHNPLLGPSLPQTLLSELAVPQSLPSRQAQPLTPVNAGTVPLSSTSPGLLWAPATPDKSQYTGRQVSLNIRLPHVEIHKPDPPPTEMKLTLPAIEMERRPVEPLAAPAVPSIPLVPLQRQPTPHAPYQAPVVPIRGNPYSFYPTQGIVTPPIQPVGGGYLPQPRPIQRGMMNLPANPLGQQVVPTMMPMGLQMPPSIPQGRSPQSPLVPPLPTPQDKPLTFRLPRNPPPNQNDREPAEKRIAYLEYLANTYIQSDELAQARQTLREMYQWLVKAPSMRGALSKAIQTTQQRIDQRMDRILRKCNSNDCIRDAQIDHQKDVGDLLGSFNDNFDLIIDNMPFLPSSTSQISDAQQSQITTRIHGMLRRGFIAPAMAIFDQVLQNPLLKASDALRKLSVTLRLLRYDLENPGGCMPLWNDGCDLDWRKKGEILDAVEDLKSPLANVPIRLKSFTPDITARILVAAGRPEVWNSLPGLRHKGDRYMAKACLALRGITSPLDSLPSSPQEGRVLAKQYYSQCVEDGGLTRAQTVGCAAGLSQIKALEHSCPFGGYVRIGLQPQVLDDYLFVKCQIPSRPPPPPPPPPPPTPSPPHPPPKPRRKVVKPCNAKKQLEKLGKVARLLDQLRGQLNEVEPIRCTMHRKLKKLKVHHKKWANTRKSMDDGLSQWTTQLKDYINQLQSSLSSPIPPKRPARRPKRGKKAILDSIKGALADLTNL